MCGIVGVIARHDGGLVTQTENCFFELLYADAVRGYDATGAICVEKDGGFHIAKEAAEATWFIPQLKGGPIGRSMWNSGRAYIGHNRKKTVGGSDDASAHPFVIEDTFAMVHNGTLLNHKALADTDIDSQALATVFKKALEQENWKEALEETLGRVWGAYATVMYDQKKELIHFLRNKERPLWIIEADNAWYFASEVMMANWVLNRNGYAYDKLKIEALPTKTLVTFDCVKKTWSKEVLVPKKPTPKPLMIGMASGIQTVMNGGAKVSKQVLKFFRRKNLGTRISFWVDDYVEVNCPKTIEADGETQVLVFAMCDEIKQTHTLTATIDLKPLGLSTKEDIFDHRWSGIIDTVELNDGTGSLLITVTGCKPVIPSKGLTHSNEPSLDQVKELFTTVTQKKSLATLRKELAGFEDHLSDWQKELYIALIKQREDELGELLKVGYDAGYDACFEEAEREGIKLIESTENGKRVLTHPTKGVVYESPVALH